MAEDFESLANYKIGKLFLLLLQFVCLNISF